jgi:hypothetical protein
VASRAAADQAARTPAHASRSRRIASLGPHSREAHIKDQYVGDVNDYFKYAFLRSVQAHLRDPLFVCWMATPDDGGTDGRRRKYLEQPDRFRGADSVLFDRLGQLLETTSPGLADVEASGILSEALFQSEVLRDSLTDRASYFNRLQEEAPENSVVFFDPDNGLEIKSVQKGRRSCSKFLFLDELQMSADQGRSVIVYQHFGRVQREPYTEVQLGRIRTRLPDRALFALIGSHIVFLIAASVNHADGLRTAASGLCERMPGVRLIELAG